MEQYEMKILWKWFLRIGIPFSFIGGTANYVGDILHDKTFILLGTIIIILGSVITLFYVEKEAAEEKKKIAYPELNKYKI